MKVDRRLLRLFKPLVQPFAVKAMIRTLEVGEGLQEFELFRRLRSLAANEVIGAYSFVMKKIVFSYYKKGVTRKKRSRFGAQRSYLLVPSDKRVPYKVEIQENFFVKSHDGTRLAADLFVPKARGKKKEPPEGFPALILVSSWVLPHSEYLQLGVTFAEKGYVVLSYTTRGFGLSEGCANIGGNDDIEDVRTLMDWLAKHAPIDSTKMSIFGISYGAVIALLAAAKDRRLKAVVAMSAATDLMDSLFGHNTPSSFWAAYLLLGGTFWGRIDPDLKKHFVNLLKGQEVEAMRAWADERSPMNYIDELNKNGTKIFMSHSWLDFLFKPETIFAFYEQLTVTKSLYVSDGIHFLTEMIGLTDRDFHAWTEMEKWLDHCVLGKNSLAAPPGSVHINVRHGEGPSEIWPSWPPPGVKALTFYLGPRYQLGPAKLLTSPPVEETANEVVSGIDLSGTTGIPALGTILDAYLKVRIRKNFRLLNPLHALTFVSAPLPEGASVRGSASLRVRVSASAAPMQLLAYLYDVAHNDIGTFITHAVLTRWEMPGEKAVDLELSFVSTAYDIPKGHRLGLVVDTFDSLYVIPVRERYLLDLHFCKDAPNALEVPVLQA